MQRHPVLFAVALLACQPVPEPPPSSHAGVSLELSLEPESPLDAAPEVVRLRIGPLDRVSELPEDVLLVEGELSDYHLGRIQKRDLPKTLLERVVPALAWESDDAIVIAPSRPLVASESYSLASPLLGRIGTVTIAPSGPPLWRRVWPPTEAGTGSEHVVFCGSGELELTGESALLDPGAYPTELAVSAGCLWLSPLEPLDTDARVVAPPLLAGVALDPAPIVHAPHQPPPPATCTAPEVAFGPGCASIEDDRLIVRSRSEPALWRVTGPALDLLEPVAADGRLVVRGLEPQTTSELELSVFDLSGREQRERVSIETGPPRLRLVIDEVLANAAGPEPMQEWVELVNDGLAPLDTAGFALEDLGGSALLPSAIVAPGERVLVVRDDFVLDDGLDVVVDDTTVVLRVEQLGKSGLSNAGEPLVLRAPDGSVVSRFPAVAASKSGRSIARRHPWSLDDDPDAFGLHAEPGASPGSDNQLE